MPRRRKRKFPQGQFEAPILRLSHDGRGIAEIDGKTVFIDRALPGETVAFHYKASYGKYDEGVTDSVVANASAHRAQPICEHFEVCGGCSWQHIDESEQIHLKQLQLQDLLKRIGHVAPQEILPPLTADSQAYRHKARLGVRVVHNKGVLIGFREADYARFIVTMQHCPILAAPIMQAIDAIKPVIAQLSNAAQIPQLEVAQGEKNTAVIIRHLEPFIAEDLQLLNNYSSEQNIHVYSQAKGPDTVKKLYPDDHRERLFYSLPDLNLKFTFHPQDFTQVNVKLNQLMVKRALTLLDLNDNDIVLDLFSGLGNFTLAMAQSAQKVVGVEGSAAMTARAYDNAKMNAIENVEFITADLTEDQSKAQWLQPAYTKIVLDPPRCGAQEMLPLLAKTSATSIVYIACDPASLARDVGILVNEYGFTLEKSGVMDMFPHTSHVESIALLTR